MSWKSLPAWGLSSNSACKYSYRKYLESHSFFAARSWDTTSIGVIKSLWLTVKLHAYDESPLAARPVNNIWEIYKSDDQKNTADL